jgi:hypothetical protein
MKPVKKILYLFTSDRTKCNATQLRATMRNHAQSCAVIRSQTEHGLNWPFRDNKRHSIQALRNWAYHTEIPAKGNLPRSDL